MVEAERRSAHCVHVEVSGLEPNRPYWYRFTGLGEQSPTGRARTTPSTDGSASITCGLPSRPCLELAVGLFQRLSAHGRGAARPRRIFLGDYIYESTLSAAGRIVRPHDGPTATDLAGYRNRYALYRTEIPISKALHAAAPCLVTRDELPARSENDYANQWSQDMRVEPAAFLARRGRLPGLPGTYAAASAADRRAHAFRAIRN